MSDQKVLLRRALGAIEDLESRLQAAESRAREPIAVVGMSCRFPGATGTAQLWRLLHDGIDAVGPYPEERWAWAAAGPPRPGIAGGFIDGLDQFDPAFFGISPREAATMDPQQRLFLEGAWHAFEDAGIRPHELMNSVTGVFVGITTSDYGQLTRRTGHDVYVATGAALNAVSGRTSFVLGLQGPCIAMDTACSSSLVAVHTACQSLRAGDCELALAGGVNALISPEPFELFGRWGMIAPDGRCKTFDAAADGFSRGEGCGVLVLKRLSDAVRQGDRVLALIRGSAVNQDGRSSGLSVPNGPAQQKVLRAALRAAGLAPTDVDYVEAHGTGTVLGDPIEVEAIAAVYGEGRTSAQPLRIGSIKTNIAHCESASGVAGLCKVILALQHEEIPPHLHFHEPNPRIAWDEYPLDVNTTPLAWPRAARPRRAGVSSFGFTGTNAHVVLEEAPPAQPRPAHAAPVYLLPVSARSAGALQAQARAYGDVLAEHPDALPEFCRAAGTERTHFALRTAIVAPDGERAAAALRALTAAAPVDREAAPRVAFLFSGQGAQRQGMGRELYRTSPLARDVLDRCAAICEGKLDVPLLDALFGDDAAVLRHTAVTQPALFALEYALAQLWQSWGVRPAAVLGHSLGEYVAATVAGALSLEDALGLVIERGRLMGELPDGGAMAAVFASVDRVQPYLGAQRGQVSLAGVNGPESVTISGTAQAVAAVMAALAADGIDARPLEVSHAFHSPLMDGILEPLRAAAARVHWQAPAIPIASNLHGRLTTAGEAFTPEYWQRHAREPVQFMGGMDALHDAGCNIFIEIGPAATLLGLGRRMLPDTNLLWLPSFAAEGEWQTLLRSAGTLWEQGLELDWDALSAPHAAGAMRIPGYAFDRRRHWIDVSALHAAPPPPADAHPLLGVPVELAADDVRVWTGTVDLERLPWLADHCVQGTVIVPATAYVELAFAAAAAVLGDGPVRLLEIANEKPLLLAPEKHYRLQTRVTRLPDGGWRFEVHSRREGAERARWVRHVSARFEALAPSTPQPLDPDALRRRCPERVDGSSFYTRLAAKGNQWGPAFQALAEAWRGDGEAIAKVIPPAGIAADLGRYRFHPAFSDGAGHVLVATGGLDRSDAATGGALVGGGIAEVRQYANAVEGELWAHAVLRAGEASEANVILGDVRIYDAAGRLVSESLGARLWYLREGVALPASELFYEVAWVAAPRAVEPVPAPGTWCLLGDAGAVTSELAARLRAPGTRVLVARPGGTLEHCGDDVVFDPASPADWDALVREAGPHCTFVHLWLLAAASRDPAAALELLTGRGPGALQHLAQALARQQLPASLRVVTTTAHHDHAAPLGASLWGYLRALAVEHRELAPRLLNLVQASVPAVTADVLTQWLHREVELCSAVHDGILLVPRLRHATLAPAYAPAAIDGTALISGGLGGIGLAVALHLARQGCRSIALLGRNVPSADPAEERWAEARDRIAEIRALGADVRTFPVNVADRDAVVRLRAELRAAGVPPVRAIFHAAGVMQYGPILETATPELEALFAGKVAGALNLVDAFGDTSVRVVFFSSNSALLPSPLMAGYAAANAVLDALAHDLRSRGVPATAINWGTWGEAGMATRFASRSGAHVLNALQTLSNREALDGLDRVLAADLPQLAVMKMDWAEWQRLYPEFTADPFFSELVQHAPAAARPQFDRATLGAADAPARRELLGRYLAECVGGILGSAGAELDSRVSISQLGFDSLMALEAKNRIEADLGIVVPMVRLLEGPSVTELADELALRLDAAELASAPVAVAAGETESFEF